MRRAIHALDSAIPVEDIHPLARNRFDALTTSRFNLWLLAAFAAIALSLAASGVYAVVGFNVAQRRREIGVRLALGAAPEGVVGFFLRGGLALVASGIVLGLAGAWAMSRTMARILFEVKPTDGVTFAVVPLVLSIVAFVAIYVPARRAANVQPTEVLRGD